jgi:diaminohydroxyphosphoribosylaminopyrimidine deaminase/5-amino-6-(5-phosphoribosylamino)uracil reductase
LLQAKETKKKPVWITNQYSRQLVHKWRSEEQAILVGTQTAIDDNPKLDVRDWTGNSPVRIVLDRNNRIPKESHLLDNQAKTIVFCHTNTHANQENLIFERIDFEQNIALQIVEVLYKHQIQSVIIEGGNQTLQTFIDENLWDEARIFKGQSIFKNGTKAPTIALKTNQKQFVLEDELIIFSKHD